MHKLNKEELAVWDVYASAALAAAASAWGSRAAREGAPAREGLDVGEVARVAGALADALLAERRERASRGG